MPGGGYFGVVGQGFQENPEAMRAPVIPLGFLLELQGKALLLQILPSLEKGLGETNVVLTWKPCL